MNRKKEELPKTKNHIILLVTTLVMSFVGLLFVFESSTAESFVLFGNQYHFLVQHSIGLAIGLIALAIGIFVPSKLWIKTSLIWYIVGITLLILVFIPGIGLSLNGARRWISIGSIRFQSIEFFKFSLIVFFSSWLNKHQRFGPFLFLTAIPSILIILQPDLGSLLLLLSIAAGMFFISGGDIKKLLVLILAGIPVVIIAIVSSPYRLKRLTTFINPESDPLGASFHIRQITLALGRGGWTGQGIGNSNQKFSYIPEASTDSIFAIIAEEIGFLGSLAILSLFVIYFYNAYKIISSSKESKAIQLLGFGIIIWIGLQVILNLSAVVGLIPLTGMPLPFFSYGKSSLVMLLFATGILVRIGKK
jgi:cell division protein FtsW